MRRGLIVIFALVCVGAVIAKKHKPEEFKVGTKGCPSEDAACGRKEYPAPKKSSHVTVIATDPQQEICVGAVPKKEGKHHHHHHHGKHEDWAVNEWEVSCGVGEATVCVHKKYYESLVVFCDDSLALGICNTTNKHVSFDIEITKTDSCLAPVCENDPNFEVLCSADFVETACHTSKGTKESCKATCSFFGVKYDTCGRRPLCTSVEDSEWSFICPRVNLEMCDYRDIQQVCRKECAALGVVYHSCRGAPCDVALEEVGDLIGAYRPQCDASGFYQPLQCHGSTGECWCSDRFGEEVNGTRRGPTEGTPVCQEPAEEDGEKSGKKPKENLFFTATTIASGLGVFASAAVVFMFSRRRYARPTLSSQDSAAAADQTERGL